MGWRSRARELRRDVAALAVAASDPRTPWPAKLLIFATVAYALSPIDLIPDPIPVLGLLDELLLLPLGIVLAIRLLPDEVLEESRARADEASAAAWGRRAAVVVIATWMVVAALLAALLLRAGD